MRRKMVVSVSVSVFYSLAGFAYASNINDVKVENCIGSDDEQAFSPHFYTHYKLDASWTQGDCPFVGWLATLLACWQFAVHKIHCSAFDLHLINEYCGWLIAGCPWICGCFCISYHQLIKQLFAIQASAWHFEFEIYHQTICRRGKRKRFTLIAISILSCFCA